MNHLTQSVLAHYRLPLLTCLGLILFVVVFLGAVIWVFRKGSGGFYGSLRSLPLEEGEGKSSGGIHHV